MGNSQNKTKGIVLDKTPVAKVEDEDFEEECVEEEDLDEQDLEEEEQDLEEQEEQDLEEEEQDLEEEEQDLDEDVDEDVDEPVVNVVDETTEGESAPIDLENGTPDEPVTEEQGSQENPLIKLPVPDKNTSFHLLIAFINLAFSRGAYTQEEVEKIIECINMFTV